MEITEVRVKLVQGGEDKLRAFCSITIDDCFVVRDLKVIEGAKGAFVAMPSRKITARCPQCRGKNHHGAVYCNVCGQKLPDTRLPRDADGRTKLHADVAHPINSECRSMIQSRVLAEYQEELDRSSDPAYRPAGFDDLDELAAGAAGAPPAGTGAGKDRTGDSGWPNGTGGWHALGAASGVSGDGSEEIPEDAFADGAGAAGGDRPSEPARPGHRIREVRTRSRSAERRNAPGERGAPPGEERGQRPDLSSRPELGGRGRRSPLSDTPSPAPSRRRPFFEDDDEPEDNFGAGLLS